jgi:hypothetical protein
VIGYTPKEIENMGESQFQPGKPGTRDCASFQCEDYAGRLPNALSGVSEGNTDSIGDVTGLFFEAMSGD